VVFVATVFIVYHLQLRINFFKVLLLFCLLTLTYYWALSSSSKMSGKQLRLAPCLKCAGPMFYNYLCKGCERPIHWFCSEGDPAMNETLGTVLTTCVWPVQIKVPRRSKELYYKSQEQSNWLLLIIRRRQSLGNRKELLPVNFPHVHHLKKESI
jgi:hypothetical protein